MQFTVDSGYQAHAPITLSGKKYALNKQVSKYVVMVFFSSKISTVSLVLTGYGFTVQFKGNLIPALMLQVEYCQMKITSCVQYLNGRPLRSCLHQANCLACASISVTFTLNELLNETYNISCIIHNELTNVVSVCSNKSLNPLPTEKLLVCSISHALLFGWVWRMDLVQRMDSSLVIKTHSRVSAAKKVV